MPNLILFDGPARDHLLPLTYTRPVAELRTGILSLREKWEKILGMKASWLTESYLQKKYPLLTGNDNLLVLGSLLPGDSLAQQISRLRTGQCLADEEGPIAWRGEEDAVQRGKEGNLDGLQIIRPDEPARRIRHPWDLFAFNRTEISSDFNRLTTGRKSAPLPEGCRVKGPHPVFIEPEADISFSTFNTSAGPVYIGNGARVGEGSLIRGPFALGPHSEVRMGTRIYEDTSTGPWCKIGGEIVSSVLMGYSNKSHEGFLGHSVLGEWCNIGADTNTSNLKNNYAPVKVWNYPERKFISTGLQLCGLIMGDHSKCGINTMFNTGTVVGVSANIFGDGFPRTFIPSFSWGGAHGFVEYKVEKAIETAELVTRRRNIELSEEDRDILREVSRLSRGFRKE